MAKRLGEGRWVPTNELWRAVKGEIEVSEPTFKRAKNALKKRGLRVEQCPVLGDGWFNCMPHLDGSGCEDAGCKHWEGNQGIRHARA